MLMLITVLINFPFERVNAEEATDDTVRGILTAIGVSSGKEASQTLSRGEATKMIITLIGADEFANYNRPVFVDVTRETENAAEINTAYDLGLIGTNAQNKFYPSEEADAEFMIELLVNMLGYADFAQIRGGSPNGYYAMALELGLLEQIDISGSLSVKDAERMIYNALDVKLVYKENNEILISNTSFLNGKLNLYKRTGMVTAYGNKSVTGIETDSSKIEIDGVEYSTADNIEINTSVGHTVEFLYRENDDESHTIIFITENTGDSPILFIDKDELDETNTDIEANRIAYKENGKTHNVRLESIRGLVNGMSKNIESSDLDFSQYDGGYIKLIPDSKGKYQYMEIVKYNNYIVSSVDANNQVVMCEGGRSISLDANEYDDNILIDVMDKYYNALTAADINIGDVLSIYESSNRGFLGIFVSSEKINAEVTSVNKTFQEVELDGKVYKLSRDMDCEAGKRYDVYIDFRGVVAKFSTDTAASNYAYLINIYQNDDATIGMTVFTASDGSVENYSAKDKFTVDTGLQSQQFTDGDIDAVKEVLSRTADANGNGIAQLVQLDMNSENEIVSVTTAITGLVSEDKFSRDYDTSGMTSQSVGFIDGRYRVASGETVIFRVPGDRKRYDEYHADMGMPTACTIGTGYLYDIDEETNVPAAIVVNMDTVQYSNDAIRYGAVCVVDDVYEGYDNDLNEVCTMVDLYIEGNLRSFKFRQGEYLKDVYGNDLINVSALKCGDILQGRYMDNTLVCAQKVYNGPLSGDEGLVSGIITDTSLTSGFVLGTGYLRSIDNNYAIFINSDEREFIANLSSTRVYIVNSLTKTVRMGSRSDIMVNKEIFYRKQESNITDVVIYE